MVVASVEVVGVARGEAAAAAVWAAAAASERAAAAAARAAVAKEAVAVASGVAERAGSNAFLSHDGLGRPAARTRKGAGSLQWLGMCAPA